MFLGIFAMLTREVSGGDAGAGPWQAAPRSRCGEFTRRRCGRDGPAISSDWDGGGGTHRDKGDVGTYTLVNSWGLSPESTLTRELIAS